VSPSERRTLFAIESEKRRRIWLLFGLLVAMVFAAAWVACLIVSVSLYLSFPVVDTWTWMFTLRGVGIVLAVALVGSLAYWGVSQIGARGRLLKAMHCRPLDPGDRYHERLVNIVDEMRIATGAPRIECVTVRTVGLNAFAFSDLRGGGVIGVTEGALARLSRQQLQAVVAHEFAHILSGGCVTVTVSCLLFGVYSALGEGLEEAACTGTGARSAPLMLAIIGLRGWLWLLQLASSITNAALSRERECQADLAAARYTRDPLSLAEALRTIGRHPGGAGYIPEGLAPLCIRGTGTLGWPAVAWRDTHPPLSERIAALVSLANASKEDFERQAAEAGEALDRREHWTTSPRAAAASAVLSLATAPASTSASAPASAAVMTCPCCGAGLATASYEGVDVTVCPRCGGRLVSGAQIGKLLARREVAFTDEQRRLADLVSTGGDHLRRAAVLSRGHHGVPLVACPRCAAPMMRRHYSYEHAVEVDHCSICDVTWFEKDELEVLQLLVERQAG
jgi:Zn-dependent protease with chaperone function/Zn-finger nucleic acid-binding protein